MAENGHRLNADAISVPAMVRNSTHRTSNVPTVFMEDGIELYGAKLAIAVVAKQFACPERAVNAHPL
jgi:hypothetical protein